MTDRMHALTHWVSSQFASRTELIPLHNDASFRRYFRFFHQNISYIVVDAPPTKENNEAFIFMTQLLAQQGITVPKVYNFDLQQGFILLSDFGDTLLLDILNAENADQWYSNSFEILHKLSTFPKDFHPKIPLFNRQHILLELSYFTEWFLTKLLNVTLNVHDKACLYQVFELLINACETQPQIIIHRDFHSRNLMVLSTGMLGTIDYQDAMLGPLTYDLSSLLKDCYVTWDSYRVQAWVKHYYQILCGKMAIKHFSFERFLLCFDWVGLQRHLKVLGIFSRLKLRDNKARYLADIPRVLHYVLNTAREYPEFEKFYYFMQDKVTPRFEAFLQQTGKQNIA
ncbi:MAG TPA: phosphotransferase [Gammaproteobacteria bacterium]|nr:phosphotransferase [Gammaproteobacteria bacterium]